MQENLFTNHTDSQEFEEHVLAQSRIREYPAMLTATEADSLLAGLIEQIPWSQDSLWIAGIKRQVPRLQCWMGDAGYGYSGLRLKREPWHPLVSAIKPRIERLAGQQFNSVLINYYRDGQDSVAWHADDEHELGKQPVIASLSLGAERPFELRPKPGKPGDKCRLVLRHGSLLVMGETLQSHWQHQLPKVRGLLEARVNLTFRTVYEDRHKRPDR